MYYYIMSMFRDDFAKTKFSIYIFWYSVINAAQKIN